MAGEYQRESANGKVDKGKFIQQAIQMANEMTDDFETDEQKKNKRKEMIGVAEGLVGKIYGFDPKGKETEAEETKPSTPPNKRPPGKPSYLIPKKETKETKNDDTDNESNKPTGNRKEEEKQPETISTPKKRPPSAKPSYLIPKKEAQPPSTEGETTIKTDSKEENANDQLVETSNEVDIKVFNEKLEKAKAQQTEKTMESDEDAHSRKKAELKKRIEKEEAEIARLEKLAKERAEVRAKLEAAAKLGASSSGRSKQNLHSLKMEAAVVTGMAATATKAAVVSSNQRKKIDSDTDSNIESGKGIKSSCNTSLSQELASLPPAHCPSPSAPPASEDTDIYSVVVPQGVRPGMAFKVDVGGKRFEVTCPPNVSSGEQIRMELPKHERKQIRSKSPKMKTANQSIVHVIVPLGISAGMPFRVAAGGTQFTVTCPPNVSAGQKIAVKVPSNPRGRSTSPKQPQPQEHYVSIPPNIHPGMTFMATVNGQTFPVTCPSDTKPGMRTKVALPANMKNQQSRSRTPPHDRKYINVTVPNGILPGQKFKLKANGRVYYVSCPPNAIVGQRIRVPIPVSESYSTGRQTSLSPVRLHNNFQPYV